MRGIINTELREFFKENLKKYNDKYGHIDASNFTLGSLDEIFKLNRKERKKSQSACLHHLDRHLGLANILTACIFTLTCSVHAEKNENGILPQNWINESGKPSPNSVFGGLLTQLTQLSISITELTERGLDNSARIILRSVIELTWQILILVYFREDLKQYVKAESFDEVSQTWWNLFGKGKIQKKLQQIEEDLAVNSSERNFLKKERKDVYQFFSESVHHGYVNTVVASIVWKFEEEAGAWCALGGASSRSDGTLATFINTSLYFIDMFVLILNKYHGTYFEKLPDLYWKESLILRDCVKEFMKKNRLTNRCT